MHESEHLCMLEPHASLTRMTSVYVHMYIWNARTSHSVAMIAFFISFLTGLAELREKQVRNAPTIL